MSSRPPVQVHSILFRPDNMVEITYAEEAEISPNVTVVRTVVLERSKFADDVDDLEVATLELVDEALLVLRNPPDEEPFRR